MSAVQHIIGRKDIVSFPSFGITHVPVKIDSGAYSSSMHCSLIQLVSEGENSLLEVVFLDPQTPGYTGEVVRFKHFIRKMVKSSNGVAQQRFFIKGTIQLFHEPVETLFSLTERTGLRNPILLGRRLLNKRFLIDTSKTNCSYKFEVRHENTTL
jgi:hypothetical protein